LKCILKSAQPIVLVVPGTTKLCSEKDDTYLHATLLDANLS
jgi:hypothetical protein